jgi:predicted ferric reductase
MSAKLTDEIEFGEPAISLKNWLLIQLAIVVGTLSAAVLLPAWLPALSTSLLGTAPKAFWFLSRGSAFVAYGLLWLSMALGLIITNKIARVWPGGPTAFDLHQFTSLLGLTFALFHAFILMGDRFIDYTFFQVVIPFASVNYKQGWVGWGQVGFYLWIVIAFSFYARSRIGTKSWRLIHFTSFAAFLLAMVHGITSGTDANALWSQLIYWTSGATLLFLFIYRILVRVFKAKPRPRPVSQS